METWNDQHNLLLIQETSWVVGPQWVSNSVDLVLAIFMKTCEILGLEFLFQFLGASLIFDVLFSPNICLCISQRTSVSVFLCSHWPSNLSVFFLIQPRWKGDVQDYYFTTTMFSVNPWAPLSHFPAVVPFSPSHFLIYHPEKVSDPPRFIFSFIFWNYCILLKRQSHNRVSCCLTSFIVFSLSQATISFIHQSLNLAWVGSHSPPPQGPFYTLPLLRLLSDATTSLLGSSFHVTGVDYLDLWPLLTTLKFPFSVPPYLLSPWSENETPCLLSNANIFSVALGPICFPSRPWSIKYNIYCFIFNHPFCLGFFPLA